MTTKQKEAIKLVLERVAVVDDAMTIIEAIMEPAKIEYVPYPQGIDLTPKTFPGTITPIYGGTAGTTGDPEKVKNIIDNAW
jgi:hypothetical protein